MPSGGRIGAPGIGPNGSKQTWRRGPSSTAIPSVQRLLAIQSKAPWTTAATTADLSDISSSQGDDLEVIKRRATFRPATMGDREGARRQLMARFVGHFVGHYADVGIMSSTPTIPLCRVARRRG